MNIKAFIKPVLEYWWLILIAGAVAVVASFVVTLFQPPVYRTHTTMVIGRMLYEANPSGNDIYLGQQLASYYANIGMRGDVRNSTQEALGLNWLPEYTMTALPNSKLLEIVVLDTNPARAQAVANELANQLILRSPTSNQQQGSEHQQFINEQISYLEESIRETLAELDAAEITLSEANSAQQIADAQQEIQALQEKLFQIQSNYAALISNTGEGAINTLSIIERAPLPTSPVGPNKMMTILLAGLVAVAIASGAAYLLAYLDDTVKSADEVTNILSVPVLGTISNIPAGNEESEAPRVNRFQALIGRLRLALNANKRWNGNERTEDQEDDIFLHSAIYPRSSVAEEFRTLRINLDFASVDEGLGTILITSPSPAEGKSSIASNLAIVIAQGGKKVILVDVDFRKPKNNPHFFIPNDKGFSDVLRGSLEVKDVLHQWKEDLSIINTGIAPPNPVDLLSSKRMGEILEDLRQLADVVIIDGPPLIFPDSLALSPKVDGVLVVLRYAFSRRMTSQGLMKQMSHAGARVVGVVLNSVPPQQTKYYLKYKY
jgi:non-specific protein-tyrosine kinase